MTTNTNKYTARMFFSDVLATEGISDEVRTYAEAQVAKLDAKKNTPTKAQLENEPIKARILEVLTTDTAIVASELGKMLEISTQKASALCRQLVAEGKVAVEDVKHEKSTVKGYTLVG